MISELELASKRHIVKGKPTNLIRPMDGVRLSPIVLGTITRLLRTVRNLKGIVYVVGGIVTEGSTLRDIDIVVTDSADIPAIKKALGKYSSRAHFIPQKGEPPATLFVKVKGVEGTTPDPFKKKKGKKIPKNEYAT